MKRICLFLLFSSLGAMESVKIDIPSPKSSKDLLNEDSIQRAISNYFKANPEVLYPHIAEPLKKKIEESSGEQLDATLEHARDSTDVEKFTQSLITDLLKEALEHKNQAETNQVVSQKGSLAKAKSLLYVAAAGAITTLTGVLVTYFTKS